MNATATVPAPPSFDAQRPPSGLMLARLLLAMVAALTFIVTAGAPQETEAATYKIVNTGGVGVRQRTSPRIASSYNGVAPEGASFTIECQLWSEPVGSYSNKLWFKVRRSGVSFSWYLADTYTNTPRKASDGPLPGIPMCGTTTSTAPPATGPYMASDGRYRFCTTTSLPGCAAQVVIPKHRAVKMHCWIDDSTVTEAYSSKRWFYVTAGDGTRGFVHSSRVARQTTVPHCSTHRGIAPARWAAMQVGETRPGPGENKGIAEMDRWSGWCYVFAWDAHKLTTGVTPKDGYGSAKATFNAYKSAGRVSTDLRANKISIGSIVFWTSGTFGHAAIYVGQGKVATTRGDGSTLAANTIVSMSTFGTPAGWVAPTNL